MGNKKQPEEALTRDEYWFLADRSDRPLLDPAIGGSPGRIVKRSEDAAASRVFDVAEQPHENRTGIPDDSFTVFVTRTPKAAHKLIPCPSEAAFKRHKDRGEPVCEPCRLAYNARQIERRRAREARKNAGS